MKGLIAGTLIVTFAALAFAGGGSKPPVDESSRPGQPVFWAKYGPREFEGDRFVIQYPRYFKVHPGQRGDMFGFPDEASFTSPDGTAEFYVNDDPDNGTPHPKWLPNLKTEVVVSTRTVPGAFLGSGQRAYARYVTIRARDGSYTRYVSESMRRCGHFESCDKAFGFKFRDARAFAKYRRAYDRFRLSIIRYNCD